MGGDAAVTDHRRVLVTVTAGDGLLGFVVVGAVAAGALGVPIEEGGRRDDGVVLGVTGRARRARVLGSFVLVLMARGAHLGGLLAHTLG
jgi:hypothetical protein